MAYKGSAEEENKANEPASGYHAMQGKKVQIFHSFAEAEAAENMAAAVKSPLERIRDTVQLILRAYGVTAEELKKRKKSYRITITRYQ